MNDFLSPDQQMLLMKIDLEIEEVIRDLDHQMEWEADDVDRTLTLQYLRWAWIAGYCACKVDQDRELDEAVSRFVSP